MKTCKEFAEFRETIKMEPACLEVSISHIPACLDALTTQFRTQGYSADELTRAMTNDIRAICPKCSIWTPGITLGMVGMFKRFGGKLTLYGYGDKSRLLEGLCVNHQCESRQIVLIWKGSDDVEQQVIRHLDRIKTDAESKKDREASHAAAMLGSPEILAFTKDVIFMLCKNCTTTHGYLRRTFPELVVWVSVLPFPASMARHLFPGGYGGFLQQLMDESEYGKGNTAMAHWIYFLEEDSRWFLNLTYVSALKVSQDKRICMLPFELLTEDERLEIIKRGWTVKGLDGK